VQLKLEDKKEAPNWRFCDPNERGGTFPYASVNLEFRFSFVCLVLSLEVTSAAQQSHLLIIITIFLK
jgi:hypothetical protein